MPVQLWTTLLLSLVTSLSGLTTASPSIPNPDSKAAFDQILQANMEIERDCKFLFIALGCHSLCIESVTIDCNTFRIFA